MKRLLVIGNISELQKIRLTKQLVSWEIITMSSSSFSLPLKWKELYSKFKHYNDENPINEISKMIRFVIALGFLSENNGIVIDSNIRLKKPIPNNLLSQKTILIDEDFLVFINSENTYNVYDDLYNEIIEGMETYNWMCDPKSFFKYVKSFINFLPKNTVEKINNNNELSNNTIFISL